MNYAEYKTPFVPDAHEEFVYIHTWTITKVEISLKNKSLQWLYVMKREFAVNFTRCLLHSFINVTQFRLSHNTNASRQGRGLPAVLREFKWKTSRYHLELKSFHYGVVYSN